MWSLFLVAGLAAFTNGASHCTKDDAACEFHLVVHARMTMWRGFGERVYLNETDCRPYIYNSNATVGLDEILLGDGTEHHRVLTLVNGTMPGPVLTVYVNQEITVHVKNDLYIENIAIHWHGLTMKGTPWMDGADFITQCPILPGQTFTYKFVADRAGTHFYHAHSSAKLNMGLFGPLIVKERTVDMHQEHILTIQDYHNSQANQKHAAEVEYGIVFPETQHFPFLGYNRFDGAHTTVVDVTSALINGRGRLYDENGTQLTCTPLSVFEVQQGNTYRFRIINAAFAYQSILSIDGHTLSVMSLDGHDTVPVSVDKVMSFSGERFDFILTANQSVGNYWIRMESAAGGRFPGYAILRYVGATTEDPETTVKGCTAQSPCTYLNCPFASKSHITCINVDELESVNTLAPAPPADTGRFKEIFVNFGFTLINGNVRAHANGVSYDKPTVSALTQPEQVNNKCAQEHGCGTEKSCRCVDSIDVQLGDVIQINLLNLGFFSIFHHPIHTHGYNFHVLKIGYRPTNDSFANFGPTPDVTCNTDSEFAVCNNASWTNHTWAGGNIPGIDLQKAPLKDTLTVPAGGYAVIRFVADNPGLWFMHCHLEWDINFLGMGIIINDSFTDVPRPPPGFPRCGSFSGQEPSATPPDINNVPRPKQDDEGYTQAQFWGLFAGLVFMILVQLAITVYCFSRRSTRYNTCNVN